MKKELERYYTNCFGYGDEDEWTYSHATDMWYEDAKEVAPQPTTSSEKVKDFYCELKIGYSVHYDEDKQQVLENDELDGDGKPLGEFTKHLMGLNDYYVDLSTTIVLKTSNVKFIRNFGQEYFLQLDVPAMWELEKFIEKLKTQSYATQYMAEYWQNKLLAWTDKKNKTRFVIQSYNDEYFNKCIMFDITIDRDVLVKKLTSVLENWKKTVYDSIKEQEKILGKKLVNPPLCETIAHFFPDLFPKP